MKIEVGKFYKTRNGRKVRIYAIDCGEYCPIHGGILGDGGEYWSVQAWTMGGGSDLCESDLPWDIVSEWIEEPEIHWERIPEYADCIHLDGAGIINNGRCIFAYDLGADWAFPNWRDFIGQTFTRPKA